MFLYKVLKVDLREGVEMGHYEKGAFPAIKPIFLHFVWMEGQPKKINFRLFCSDLLSKSQKTRYPEAELQELVYFGIYFGRSRIR